MTSNLHKKLFKRNNILCTVKTNKSRASYIKLCKRLYRKSEQNRFRWLGFRLKYLNRILKEDGELRCIYCGRGKLNLIEFHKDEATIDHLEPVSKTKARFDTNNMVVACHLCNQLKSSMSLDTFLRLMEKMEVMQMRMKARKDYSEQQVCKIVRYANNLSRSGKEHDEIITKVTKKFPTTRGKNLEWLLNFLDEKITVDNDKYNIKRPQGQHKKTDDIVKLVDHQKEDILKLDSAREVQLYVNNLGFEIEAIEIINWWFTERKALEVNYKKWEH